MEHSDKVRKYYNQNTKRFVKWGDQGSTRTIHQPLWKNKDFSKTQALHYPHELIQVWIRKLSQHREGPLHIADYGSGVGASIQYLAQQNSADYFYGITISENQHSFATNWLKDSPRVKSILADFVKHQPSQSYNLIFQIESFNHVEKRLALIDVVSQSLGDRGYWIVMDDFLENRAQEHSIIRQYEYGWVLGKLQSLSELENNATLKGLTLIHQENLTPYLRLERTRDQWIRFFLPLIKLLSPVSAYARSWYGGMGRQQSLKKGLISYRMVVFEKGSD